MKQLASVLAVLALVASAQAGVILSEDFEGATAGTSVNGYNGWSGSDNIVISSDVIGSGQSASWADGSTAWPSVSKGFSYTPGAGESYVLTATVYSPTTNGTDAEVWICNSSNPSGVMQGVAVGYGDMQFGVMNTSAVVKIPPQPTAATDVMLVLEGNTSTFYYRAHGDVDWISAGGFTDLAWSASDYDTIRISGHGGMAGGVDSIVLTAVPEPATMSLLTLGGLGVLLRRKR